VSEEDKSNFIGVTGPAISGYFAVEYWWNPDGFWEPWQTGIGRYSTKEEAIAEARYWAETEGIEFRE
jgi:hypothetical protein